MHIYYRLYPSTLAFSLYIISHFTFFRNLDHIEKKNSSKLKPLATDPVQRSRRTVYPYKIFMCSYIAQQNHHNLSAHINTTKYHLASIFMTGHRQIHRHFCFNQGCTDIKCTKTVHDCILLVNVCYNEQ